MDGNERADVVRQLIRLLDEHYVFPEVAAALAGPLTARLADGSAVDGLPAFAAASRGSSGLPATSATWT